MPARRLGWLVRRAQAALGAAPLHAVAPLAIVLTLSPWLLLCAAHYLDAPLFRDVGMFRYSAWCVSRGLRLYDDIAAPDGPFAHLFHLVLLALTGTSERAFRKVDLGLQLAVGAAIGALVAPVRSPEWRSRAVFALLGAGLWLTYYFQFDWAASAQREAYYGAFGYVGLALVYASSRASARRARAMLVAAGVVLALPTFGKQTSAAYGALGLLAAVLPDPAAKLRPRARVGFIVTGALVALAGMLAWLAAHASFRGLWFWYFVYPLDVYRHMANWAPLDLFESVNPTFGTLQAYALAGGLGAVALRLLPLRAMGFVLAPSAMYAAAIELAKGWNYHFHPVVAGVYVLLLVALAAVWDADADAFTPARRAVAWGLLALTAAKGADGLSASFWLHHHEDLWNKPEIATPRQVAGYLRDHTAPSARVFYYGDDSHALFLAQRLPANPYQVAWLLDFRDALLARPAWGVEAPAGAVRGKILTLEGRVQADACARTLRRPPDAFVLEDHVTLGADGLAVVTGFCPAVTAMLHDDYASPTTIGNYHIYVRRPAG